MEWREYRLVISILGDHGLLFCSGRPGTYSYDRLAIWNPRTEAPLAVRSRRAIYTMPGF